MTSPVVVSIVEPPAARGLAFRALAFAASLLALASAPAHALPDFTAAPTTLGFGSVVVGSTSSPIDIVITNVSGSTLTLSLAGGAPFDPFDYGAFQSCGATLASGASCDFTYSFHPLTLGAKPSRTTIAVNGESFPITLSGTGISSTGVTAAPTTLDFGRVTIGQTSSALSVMFTNTSGSAVTPAFTGGEPGDTADFSVTQNCVGATLAAGASCEYTYAFAPATGGTKSTAANGSVDGAAFEITLRGVGDVQSVPTLAPWALATLAALLALALRFGAARRGGSAARRR